MKLTVSKTFEFPEGHSTEDAVMSVIEQLGQHEWDDEDMEWDHEAGENGWIRVEPGDSLPQHRVLCTNNLEARDANGCMSHVWIGRLEHSGRTIGCWTYPAVVGPDALNITHYKEIG